MKLWPFLLAYALVNASTVAQDSPTHWNQFRGANGDGISVANGLPIKFDESKNVRWKVAIPDQGWSSPVVWENEIWLTTGSDEKKELRALCVEQETGRIIKDIKVFDMIERKIDPAYAHDSPHLNSPATPTPVVEAECVYVSFGSQGIACLNRTTGDRIWERRDLRIYQPVRQGSSPIVDGKNLYIAFDGTDQQFFVALDKATGDTRWKTDRNVGTDWEATLRSKGLSSKKGGKPNDNKKSFATATLIEVDGQRQLIAPAAEATIAYAPDTGKELWRALHPGGFNVAARPIYANGLVYVFTSGLTGYLMGIRPNGTGDVTETHVAWSTTRSTPAIPSPVIVDDLLFMVTDKGGIARCLDARTGEEIWTKRLGGDHWASPFYANGRLYFSSKQGDITVLEVSRSAPEILARNKMHASFIASPAVAGDSLILRSTTHLYCVSSGYQRSEQEVAREVMQRSPEIAGKTQNDRKTQKAIDWGAAYEEVLKSNPAVRKKVESGGATKEQVIAWLKQRSAKGMKNKPRSKAVRDQAYAKPGVEDASHNFPETASGYAKLVEPALGVPPRIDLGKSVEIPLYVNGVQTYGNLGRDCDNPTYLGKDTISGSTLQRHEGRTADGKPLPDVIWVSFGRNSSDDNKHVVGSVQMIGYNKKTGATAFFESRGSNLVPWVKLDEGTLRMRGVMPWIDNPKAFNRAFIPPGNVQCVECHQADPFITNSFINAAKIPGTSESVVPALDRDSPYYVIGGENWDMRTIHIEGNSCFDCHRVGMSTMTMFIENGWDPSKHMPPHDPGSLSDDLLELLEAWKQGPKNVPGAEWIIPPARGKDRQFVGDDYLYQSDFNQRPH